MTISEILLSQLTDPFRLGLIVALVVTMLRTEAVTGRWVPLATGVVFVAFILPLTTARGMAEGGAAHAASLGRRLAAGGVFVALLLPPTAARGMAEGGMAQAVALGIVANLVLLALVM